MLQLTNFNCFTNNMTVVPLALNIIPRPIMTILMHNCNKHVINNCNLNFIKYHDSLVCSSRQFHNNFNVLMTIIVTEFAKRDHFEAM